MVDGWPRRPCADSKSRCRCVWMVPNISPASLNIATGTEYSVLSQLSLLGVMTYAHELTNNSAAPLTIMENMFCTLYLLSLLIRHQLPKPLHFTGVLGVSINAVYLT